jgi:phosphoglycolate phosphatase-like HAD superfamily hydrolase
MNDKLILFDIDETLIDSGRAGTRALNSAFAELFGIEDAFRNVKMAGMTDIQIMKEALRMNGLLDGNGRVNDLIDKYIVHLQREIDNPWRKVKPGVFELIESLVSDAIPLGLLTGNLEAGAKIKLTPFGLQKYFPAGAFGSDDEDRDKLVPIAIRKFSELGINASPEKCVVIGDTPRDVRCAKVHNAFCIATATGPYSKEALADAGADLTVETLKEKDACIDFIHSI